MTIASSSSAATAGVVHFSFLEKKNFSGRVRFTRTVPPAPNILFGSAVFLFKNSIPYSLTPNSLTVPASMPENSSPGIEIVFIAPKEKFVR